MNQCKLDDENFKQLIFAIRKKKCILMLGPDASVEEAEGKLQPLNKILASELAEKLKSDFRKDINPSHLTEVSQYYQIENKDRNRLESFVEIFYNKRQHSISEIHQNLAALPFYFTVTASPDKMFANALTEKGKPPQISVYNFRGGQSDNEPVTGTKQNPLLFYLYGTADELESLVITENDLMDFLVAVISKTPRLPSSISSELDSADKNFLFLGFGFKHWYLRILLHILVKVNKKNQSFALEFMPENPNEYKSAILFFKNHNSCKIHIFHDELLEFTRRLKTEFDKSLSCAPTVPEQDKPSVFICHANPDKLQAEWFFQEFTKAGFNPFLDKEHIEAGVNWDRLIEKTIKKTDFFIILKSKSLEKRPVGYVHKEINLALEKQKHFTPDSPFIIPVKIEECGELDWDEELGRLQYADLTDKANINKLITDIKRHYERRKKRGQ